MKGWFNQSHRHSLASRGISTNKYFLRKRKLPKGSVPSQLPRTKKSVLGMKDPENFLKISFIRSKPKSVQKEFFDKLNKSRVFDKEIEDLELKITPLAAVNRRRRALLRRLKNDDTLSADDVTKLVGELEDINEELEFAKFDETRVRLNDLKRDNSALKDELAALSGSKRGVRSPLKLTHKQMERRLRKENVDVESFKDELLGMNRPQKIAFLKDAGIETIKDEELKDLSSDVIDSALLTVGLRNKVLEVNPQLTKRGASNFSANRDVGEVVKKTGLLRSERPTFVKRLEKFQEKQQKANDANAPRTVHTDPEMIERLKARQETQKNSLARAKETRDNNRRIKLAKQDIESAKKEEKELKERGEFSE